MGVAPGQARRAELILEICNPSIHTTLGIEPSQHCSTEHTCTAADILLALEHRRFETLTPMKQAWSGSPIWELAWVNVTVAATDQPSYLTSQHI